jgi:hypothetical protein
MLIKLGLREYTRDAKDFARHNEWFQTAAILVFGALLDQLLQVILPGHHIVLIPMLLFMAALLGLPLLGTYRRRRKTKVFLNANRELRDPDPLAERRVRQHTEPCPVIGLLLKHWCTPR